MRNFIINDALYHDLNIFGTCQAILKSGKDNILPHPSYSSANLTFPKLKKVLTSPGKPFAQPSVSAVGVSLNRRTQPS